MILFFLFGCQTESIPPDGNTDVSTTNVETVAKPPAENVTPSTQTDDPTTQVPETAPSSSDTTAQEATNDNTQDPVKTEIPIPNIDSIKPQKERQITAEELDSHMNKQVEEEKEKPEEKAVEETPNEEVLTVKEESAINAYFNEENGQIFVRVFKDTGTLASGMAHDHVILAQKWEGQIQWKESEPHNCMIEFQVPVHFLQVDSKRMRKQVKLPGTVSKGDQKTIKENMLAKNQLYSQKYPYITLSANECTIIESGVRIDANLKVRGKEVTVLPIVKIDTSNGIKVQGKFNIKVSSFGIQPYSGFFGAVKNKDIVSIHINLHDK